LSSIVPTCQVTCTLIGSSTSSVTMATYGVPQGSVFGPLMYIVYVTLVGRLISSYDIKFHQYDDTQPYTRLSSSDRGLTERFHQCAVSLQHWSWSNGMLLGIYTLPVRQRIDYKISTLCFKAYRLHQPPLWNSLPLVILTRRRSRTSTQKCKTVYCSDSYAIVKIATILL
jgi:hypothetical protein